MNAPSPRAGLTTERVVELRSLLPATAVGAYLNCGTAGPLPIPVIDAMRSELERQLTRPRSGIEHLDRYVELAELDRSAISTLLGCAAGEVALTHSTTEGMNAVTLGVDWRSGDRVLTTDLEHPGVLFPLYVARERFGVDIDWVTVTGLDDEEIVAAIDSAMTPRTRLVSLSHVSFQNGLVLPIRHIADVVHAHGAILLVDGAQSLGALPIDVVELGVDAFSGSGQKWLLGPEGTGALFCRAELLERLGLVAASYATATSSGPGTFTPHRDGRRLEFGTTNPVGYVGQAAAVEFVRDTVGIAGAATRAEGLAGRAITALRAIEGVTVLTPAGRHANLVTFAIDGHDALSVVETLAQRAIFVRPIFELDATRISAAFFTTDAEIAATINSIGEIAASRK